LDSGELMSARRVLAAPQTLPRTLGLAQLGVRLERDGENEPRLARALEELGAVEDQPLADRARALLEASNLWRRLGDDERACQCARSAASWVPEDAEAQILASYLEYRRRGPRSRDEARATLERLSNVVGNMSADQLDLAGFLLAEAVDIVEGGDAGLVRLLALKERLGPSPLVSVGLAERLARGPSPREALEHFDIALLGGDLRGLRKPSRLALEAAQAAKRSELFGLVHRYTKLAEADPELAEAAARLREELPSASSPGVAPSQAPKSSPDAAAAGPVTVRRGFAAAVVVSEELEHETRPARRTQMGLGRTQPRHRATQPGGNLLAPGVAPAPAPTAREPFRAPKTEVRRTPRQNGVPPEVQEFVPRSAMEKSLFEDLKVGVAAAGQELFKSVIRSPERADDALSLSLQLSKLEPGARSTLEVIEQAAEAIGDSAHHAAIVHVRQCSGEMSPTNRAPPLHNQTEQVDLLRRLLFNEPDGLWPKALEVIWESTRRVLEWESVRDVKAAQRVRSDQRSPLAQTFAPVARLLGLGSTPLLQLSATGEPKVSVLVLGEASVLVRGEPTHETSQLRYDIGAALAGTLPPYVIINAATYEQIDDLFRAVHIAFGAPESSQTNLTSTARLAALLWESVAPRTQRMMIEWCKEGKLTRELAVASARRAARRSGLFASGDLGVALSRVVAEEGIDSAQLAGPGWLARLCAKSAAAADLVRLACDPMFAHLRWCTEPTRPGAGLTRRGL
jgi:hypothetical protein